MVRRVDLMSGQVLNTSLVFEKFFRVMFARFSGVYPPSFSPPVSDIGRARANTLAQQQHLL
jgi:hypothetical protein